MGRTWADLKTKDDQRPAKRAPTLLVEVEEDGEHWFIRIREWGLYGQAESLGAVETVARDLIGQSVGIAIVLDALEAAEAERNSTN